MAQERFLIFGASSFYGRNFAEYVRAQGEEAVEMSLRGWLPRWIDKAKADCVVNFAAANIVADSWDRPGEYAMVNVVAHTDLIDFLARRNAVQKYIHVSTPEVYGHTPEWVDETYTNWKPSTPYAVSRAAADMLLMAYHRARGFPGIITRTANIYGLGQGENRIIPLAFKTKEEGGQLGLHGGGGTVRSFIHVRDACDATYQIAKRGKAGETYHISTRQALSIKELCDLIGLQTGTQPDRLGKDKTYLLNSDKVRSLGWSDTITLEKGLEEYGKRN